MQTDKPTKFWTKKLSAYARWSVLAIVIIASVINLSSPFVQEAAAATVNSDTQSPSWRAQSWWYYEALNQCTSQATFNWPINQDDVQNFKWVTSGSNGSVGGFYMRDILQGIGSDGRANCNEGQDQNQGLFYTAFHFWGLNDGVQVACDAGVYSRINKSPCAQGNQDFQMSNTNGSFHDELMSYIKKTIYGGSEPTLTSSTGTHEADYIFNYNTFVKACAYGTQPLTTKPTGSMVYSLIDPTNKPVWFAGTQDFGWNAQYSPNPDTVKSCLDLVNAANDAAKDYQAWLAKNPGVQDTVAGSGQSCNDTASCKTTSNCAIDGIGWIVCPVVKFLGSVADSAYSIISQLLTVQPLSTDTSAHNGVYTAWAAVRNIANIVFVIAFLIIIYSQISGMGVSNYGIKKLLPKLIVAAILVNASYWICAIAVDLSNIAGTSVTSFLKSVTDGMPAPQVDPASQFWNGADGSSGIIAKVLAGGIALYLGLTVLLPVLIAVIAAALSALIVLMLRQALIVILIFISPLAFVALLLPNTEDLFKRWRQLFTTMLLMFPIVAVVFSGSALASRVLNISANTADAQKGDFNLWLMQITAAGVAVIPLFIVPVLMKAAGGLLHRFAGIVNNPNKGMFDRMRKGAENVRERQENRRALRSLDGKPTLSFGKYQRSARRSAIDASLKAGRSRYEQQYIADEVADDNGKATRFGRKLAGGDAIFGAGASTAAVSQALANAKFTIEKAELEEVKAESVLIENKQMEDADGKKGLKTELAETTSAAKRAAILERMVQIGKPEDYIDEVNRYGHSTKPEDSIVRKTLARSLAENGPQFLKAGDIDAIKTGNMKDEQGNDVSFNDMIIKNAAAGVYSQEKMVADTGANLDYARTVLESAGAEGSAGRERMRETAKQLLENEVLKGKIKHNATAIQAIAGASAQIPGQGTLFE